MGQQIPDRQLTHGVCSLYYALFECKILLDVSHTHDYFSRPGLERLCCTRTQAVTEGSC
ncbi:hypothetical protein RIEGSTA812A_PEG_525 [invertebrate metagenome]|uniref:Uncharacterized protein n=1 Tax=invertebrate metagenome TaxID=1711999 RepID=A0A484HBA1_9ZZZZ